MKISSVVHIDPGSITLNDVILFSEPPVLTEAYRKMKLDYGKFHKMDTLSKIGLIGVECLQSVIPLNDKYRDDRIALIFNNRYSSLEPDMQHEHYMLAGNVRPAVFVYTLPNIVLGEIAIRNKWYGEQVATVTQKPDGKLLFWQCNSLLSQDKADAIILLNIDVAEETFHGKILLIEKNSEEYIAEANGDTLNEILN